MDSVVDRETPRRWQFGSAAWLQDTHGHRFVSLSAPAHERGGTSEGEAAPATNVHGPAADDRPCSGSLYPPQFLHCPFCGMPLQASGEAPAGKSDDADVATVSEPSVCRNEACSRLLFGPVAFCPYCAHEQKRTEACADYPQPPAEVVAAAAIADATATLPPVPVLAETDVSDAPIISRLPEAPRPPRDTIEPPPLARAHEPAAEPMLRIEPVRIMSGSKPPTRLEGSPQTVEEAAKPTVSTEEAVAKRGEALTPEPPATFEPIVDQPPEALVRIEPLEKLTVRSDAPPPSTDATPKDAPTFERIEADPTNVEDEPLAKAHDAPQAVPPPAEPPPTEPAHIDVSGEETAHVSAPSEEPAQIAAPIEETARVAAPVEETAPVAAPVEETAHVAFPVEEVPHVDHPVEEIAPSVAAVEDIGHTRVVLEERTQVLGEASREEGPQEAVAEARRPETPKAAITEAASSRERPAEISRPTAPPETPAPAARTVERPEPPAVAQPQRVTNGRRRWIAAIAGVGGIAIATGAIWHALAPTTMPEPATSQTPAAPPQATTTPQTPPQPDATAQPQPSAQPEQPAQAATAQPETAKPPEPPTGTEAVAPTPPQASAPPPEPIATTPPQPTRPPERPVAVAPRVNPPVAAPPVRAPAPPRPEVKPEVAAIPQTPPVQTPPQPDPKLIECRALVRAGRQALNDRNYDTAIANATEALSTATQCPGAQQLATEARKAKQDAQARTVIE